MLKFKLAIPVTNKSNHLIFLKYHTHMKFIFFKTAYSSFFGTLILCSTIVYGQKNFTKLTSSTDSTFGYTVLNPLKLKKGSPDKSIINSRMFLMGLKTLDNQSLQQVSRSSIKNHAFNCSVIQIKNRFTEMPVSGKLGILDKYVFLTSNTKDTIILFVDIYNKGHLEMPIGLKYE